MDSLADLRGIAIQAAQGDVDRARDRYLQIAAALLDNSIEPLGIGDLQPLGNLGQDLRVARAALLSAKALAYPIVRHDSEVAPDEFANQENGLSSLGASMSSIADSDVRAVGFVHVAMMGEWRSVFDDLIGQIRRSGLLERVEQLVVSCVGGTADLPDVGDHKVQIVHASPDLGQLECPTLDMLHTWCATNEGRVFYVHTKGVQSSRSAPTVHDWRRYMAHFVLDEYQACMKALHDHDLAGVNWQFGPWPHFSGNYWWARSDYVRRLPSIPDWLRQCADIRACERWIGTDRDARVACLHQSLVNHYLSPYPPEEYHLEPEAEVTKLGGAGAVGSQAARQWSAVLQEHLTDLWPIATVVTLATDAGIPLDEWAAAFPLAKVVGVDPYGCSQSNGLQTPTPEAAPLNGVPGPSPERWQRVPLPGIPNAFSVGTTSRAFAVQFAYPIDILQMDPVAKYDDITKDFALWEPKVRPGGFILFHDTQRFPNDVGRFFDELNGAKILIPGVDGLAIWRKPLGSSVGMERKCALPSRPSASDHLLSILIPTLPSRRTLLPRLLDKLDRQLIDEKLAAAVEILLFEDNKELTVGEKRNLLMCRATGQFVVFIDDDDDVDDQYLAQICAALACHPDVDCLGFSGELHSAGLPPEPTIYSLQYRESKDWGEIPGCRVFLRPPQHVNPIRRDVAIQFPFPSINWGEDQMRAASLARSGLLKKECFLGTRVMYHYRFNPGSSETLPRPMALTGQ